MHNSLLQNQLCKIMGLPPCPGSGQHQPTTFASSHLGLRHHPTLFDWTGLYVYEPRHVRIRTHTKNKSKSIGFGLPIINILANIILHHSIGEPPIHWLRSSCVSLSIGMLLASLQSSTCSSLISNILGSCSTALATDQRCSVLMLFS